MRPPPRQSLTPAALGPQLPLVLLVGVLGLLLWRFPPDQYPFWPSCPVFRYLHLQCPGCGTTRALAALLRGHLSEALRLNALTTLLLPFGLWYSLQSCRRDPASARVVPPEFTRAALVAALLFTVVRNLPG